MNTKFWIGVGLIATVTSVASWSQASEQKIEKKVIVLNGSPMHEGISDRLTIRDLDTLVIGEARSYTSPGGKEFSLTRDAEEHWTLSGQGKEFGFGGDPADIETIEGGEGQTAIKKRVVILHGGDENGAAEIHTLAGGEGEKRVQVFVDKSAAGEPEVQRILINGHEADPSDGNIQIIVKKDAESAGEGHAIWIDKSGVQHEGLPDHGVMMIDTETIEGGAGSDATMVEIIRESGNETEKRVEKRVFLFVGDGEEN